MESTGIEHRQEPNREPELQPQTRFPHIASPAYYLVLPTFPFFAVNLLLSFSYTGTESRNPRRNRTSSTRSSMGRKNLFILSDSSTIPGIANPYKKSQTNARHSKLTARLSELKCEGATTSALVPTIPLPPPLSLGILFNPQKKGRVFFPPKKSDVGSLSIFSLFVEVYGYHTSFNVHHGPLFTTQTLASRPAITYAHAVLSVPIG